MKKLEISNYPTPVLDKNGNKIIEPFFVRESLGNLLLHPSLMLNGRELLVAQKLATKIEEETTDFILLENPEYERLVLAASSVRGFGRNEVELVRRIYEAPDVDVEEKK